MKAKINNWLIALLILLGGAEATTAKEMKFGSGGQNGTYFGMVDDIIDYCGEPKVLGQDRKGKNNILVNVEEKKGSVGSLLAISQKKYLGGVTQEDVLQFYHKTDPSNFNQNRLKIVSGLHLETAHLLIPKNFKPSSGGGMWGKMWGAISNKPPAPLNIESLRGESIAAWGGSIVSAKALSYFLGLEANVVTIKSGEAANSPYPILIVAGQPSSTVQDLLATGKFILAPIDSSQLAASQPFYRKMEASYEVDGEIMSVPTFGVRAFLIAKAARKESRNLPLSGLAGCIVNNLEDMADDSETNPNWSSVYELNRLGQMTNWAYFPIKESVQ